MTDEIDQMIRYNNISVSNNIISISHQINKNNYTILQNNLEQNNLGQNDWQQNGGAVKNSRYACDPTKKFSNICNLSDKGEYKTHVSCVNDCERKYIMENLNKANLRYESTQFTRIIDDLLKIELNVYIKGGTVLGLKILKMVYDRYYKNPIEFAKYFKLFLELDLVRDWDFVAYTKDEIDDVNRKEMDQIARKNGLVPRAKTFILYQARKPIQLEEQALFEIAVLDNDNLGDLELPMTTMKSKVTLYNLKKIFMFAKIFYSMKTKGEEIDIDVIKHLIKDMRFTIYPHHDGLFNATDDRFDDCGLTPKMFELMGKVTKDRNMVQFLATHIAEPHRLFYRLLEKNIPKTERIVLFLKKNKITKDRPSWLFDTKIIMNMIEYMIDMLGREIATTYLNKLADHAMINISDHTMIDTSGSDKKILKRMKLDDEKAKIEIAVGKTDELIGGINLSRMWIEYDKFTETGRDLVKRMFGGVNKEIGKMVDDLSDDQPLIRLLKFLNKKKLFD
jgi:hypothetical protein